LPVSDKLDSSDICFVPDRDYARLVRERLPQAFKEGEVRDQSGRVVGRHEGTPNYTIGQRRGLGIAMGAPIYVTGIDASTNTVVVGPKERLLARALEASDMNWLDEPPGANRRVYVQIRYSHQAAPATVRLGESGCCRVDFEEPQVAVTPGQAVVLYDEDVVLGGGWIDRAIEL
jgi:tRNA-specific 2-thiouridylase